MVASTKAAGRRPTDALPSARALALAFAFARKRMAWLSVRARSLNGRPRDAGMATAEYAIGVVAACALAAILYRVVTSDTVSGALSELLNRALHAV